MSRVKAEKSDVKILNRGKVAGKTKGPETPPPFQQGLIMGLADHGDYAQGLDPFETGQDVKADHGDYAQGHDPIETGQDVNPEETAQDADIKDTSQDIHPSETSQDADETDNDQDIYPGGIAQDEKFPERHFFLEWPSGRVAEFFFSYKK